MENRLIILQLLAIMIWLRARPVTGHGRLLEPPSRSTMWRYGYPNPPNYNDNQLFCGGFQVQWTQNGGKCGVCGDPWQGPWNNEPGGKYANGIMARKYKSGEQIEIIVELTANHHGWMEFRLCQNDDPRRRVRQECFDQNLLHVAETDETRLYAPEKGQYHKIATQFRLPAGVKCRACVLQWRYNAGNSWGLDKKTNRGCIGCGPQEQFYGCADIAIGYDDVHIHEPDIPDIVELFENEDQVPDWQRTDHPPPPLIEQPVVTDADDSKDKDGDSALSDHWSFEVEDLLKMKMLVHVFGNEILQHEFTDFIGGDKFQKLIGRRQMDDVCQCKCNSSGVELEFHLISALLCLFVVSCMWWNINYF